MNKSILSIFVVAVLISGFFVVHSTVAVGPSPSVIINEFSSASDVEWVELLNTTDSDISLTDWTIQDAVQAPKSLSGLGIIPAHGIVVFEQSLGWLNNTPATETITVFDNTNTPIHSISFGSDSGVDVTAPTAEQSGSYNNGTWSISETPTKGWFNDAGEEGKAPLLSDIDSFMLFAGINSNIGELDNPSATPATEDDGALYFEKEVGGKIIFEKTLNLSDQATVAVLQDLGEAMEISDGHIAFDSEIADDMNATGAKIYMYGLNELGFNSEPNIIVKNDEGETISGAGIVDDVNYNPETGTLSFTASHFTQFEVAKGIFGTKWNDLDGDGIRDWEDINGNDEKDGDEEYTEPGLEGWTIMLSDDDGEETETVTDADGAYSFLDIEDGEYTVCEVLKSGWTQTYPNGDTESNQDVSSDCDDDSYGYELEIDDVVNVSNLDFGNVQKAHITVRKVAYPASEQEFDFNFDNDGIEEFSLSGGDEQTFDVVPGDYTISETVPEGWRLEHIACEYNGDSVSGVDTSNGKTVTIDGGDTIVCTFTNIDAGLTIITGYKWEDTNGDGEKDDGEPGRKNWQMALGRQNGDPFERDGHEVIPIEIVELSLTGTDGWYYLPVIEQGDYKVFEEKRDGWSTTNPSAIDSFFDITYRIDSEPQLVEDSFFGVFVGELSGQTITSDVKGHPLDFGNFDLIDITGFKWDDKNGDGAWDKDEPGLPDVIMALGRQNGDPKQENGHETIPIEIIAMDLTGSDGDFVIHDIGPGHYKLFEESKSGWKATNPTSRADSFFDITYNLDYIGDPDFDLLRIGDPDFDLLRQSFFDVFVEFSGQNVNQSETTQTTLTNIPSAPLEFGNHKLLVIGEETETGAEQSSIVISWTTDFAGTSRVVYDTVSHAELGSSICAEPNESLSCYGYANTTTEQDTDPKVTDHDVSLTGLTSGITYYYRVISKASPESVGGEESFDTDSLPTPTPTPAPENNSGGGGGGGGGNGVGNYLNGPLANNGGTVSGATTTASPTPTSTPNPIPISSGQTNPTLAPEVNSSELTGSGQVSPTPTGGVTPKVAPLETPMPSTQPLLLSGNIGNIFGLGTGNWMVALIVILAVLLGAYWLIKRKPRK